MATAEEILRKDLAFTDDFVATADGDLDTQSGLENYKRAVIRRCITVPGSLVHRPNYGVGLPLYINSISYLPTQQKITAKINEQLMKDPRTKKVLGVIFLTNNIQPNLSKLTVRVLPVGYDEVSITFPAFQGL